MAISAKNQKRLSAMSPNLIYAFIPEREIRTDVFGKYTAAIKKKRDYQRTFINATAKAQLYSNPERFYDFTREQLEEVYGKSVQDIIYYLAQYGALPAVKYEGETVNGIGSLSDGDFSYNFNQAYGGNNSITFNPDTGKLVFSGRQLGGGIVSYDNTGRQYLNTYDSASGYTFGSLYQGGQWNLYSASNGDSTYNLVTGKSIDSKQNQFWNNLANALPAISGLLATVLTMLQGTLNPTLMSPNQIADGWVQPYGTTRSSLNTLLVLGLIGGAVWLLADDGGKKKK